MKTNPKLSAALRKIGEPVAQPDALVVTAAQPEPTPEIREIAKVPPHRETSSERAMRIQTKVKAEREKALETKKKTPKELSREQQLAEGFVKARATRGSNRDWQFFTQKEWEALGTSERQKFNVVVSKDPNNLYNLNDRVTNARGGTRVIATLGPTRVY